MRLVQDDAADHGARHPEQDDDEADPAGVGLRVLGKHIFRE